MKNLKWEKAKYKKFVYINLEMSQLVILHTFNITIYSEDNSN